MSELQHVGVLGMRWGHRKGPQTIQTAHKRNGKHFIVDKTKFGDTVSKKQVTKEEFDSFMTAQKQKKLSEITRKKENWERVSKGASLLIATYSAVSIAQMLYPTQTNRVIGTIAWNLGKVVSNSPIR